MRNWLLVSASSTAVAAPKTIVKAARLRDDKSVVMKDGVLYKNAKP